MCNVSSPFVGCWKLYTQVAGQSAQKSSESVEFKAPGQFVVDVVVRPNAADGVAAIPFIGDQKQHQDT